MTSYVSSLGSFFDYGNYIDPSVSSDRNVHNGVFWIKNSNCQVKDVIDGQSHTLMFGEHVRLQASEGLSRWFSGYNGDTFFSTWYPFNKSYEVRWSPPPNRPAKKLRGFECIRKFVDASSYHPGGANFSFADGSVHFLSETIDSADPTDMDFLCMIGCGGWCDECISPNVYQALGTRNGGEAIGGYGFGVFAISEKAQSVRPMK